MKQVNQKIQELHATTQTIAAYFTDRSFSSFQNDNLAQGEILDNLQQAKDHCYDLGMAIVRQYGWNAPETLEELLDLLNQHAVIDSDLVDQMIAMYRFRGMSIKDKLEANDLDMVDQIIRQDLADMGLFHKQVKEFVAARSKKREDEE